MTDTDEDDGSSTSSLDVPSDVPGLEGVRYLHNLFPEEFLAELDEIRDGLTGSMASSNMYANRRFLRSNELARKVLSYLPKELGYTHVLSDMRFIEYPPGGHILPHVDGVRRDEETSGAESTTSFLLFTEEIPEGEGGETEFLESVDDDAKVLFGARPNRGSILLFPHGVAHRRSKQPGELRRGHDIHLMILPCTRIVACTFRHVGKVLVQTPTTLYAEQLMTSAYAEDGQVGGQGRVEKSRLPAVL